MAPYHPLTFLQKIDIPIGVTQVLTQTVFATLIAPFRGENTQKTIQRHVMLYLVRGILARLSTQQLQAIAGTTESNYLSWTKGLHLEPQIVSMPDFNTKAFWHGNPKAKNLVIYVHGGGFAMPASTGTFSFVSSLVSKATKVNKSVAVLILQYDLAPAEQYPRQNIQVLETLRHAIENLGFPPERIMLLGDSSGGNLILGTLSHLLHPHPAMRPLKLTQPLAAALLSSPVTVLNTDSIGFKTQEAQDPGGADTIRIWLRDWLGTQQPDSWNQPLTNEPGWWTGLDTVAKEILVTIATKEMMAADTRACVSKIKTVYSGVTLFGSETDFHAEPNIGPAIGLKEGEAAQTIISFAIDRF